MLRVKLVYDKIKAKWKENFMIMDAALCEARMKVKNIYLFNSTTMKTMEREFMAITWIFYVEISASHQLQNTQDTHKKKIPLENVLTITDLLSHLMLLIKSKINLLKG